MRDYNYYSFLSKYTAFLQNIYYIYYINLLDSYNIYIKFYMNFILNAERKSY